MCAHATKFAASGNVVPPPLARRDKAIQHGSVAGGPADERSVMLCESESSGVRRGVFRPCKSGNLVVYWSQSSKKRQSIDCRRSDKHREGKEGVRTGSYWRWPDH